MRRQRGEVSDTRVSRSRRHFRLNQYLSLNRGRGMVNAPIAAHLPRGAYMPSSPASRRWPFCVYICPSTSIHNLFQMTRSGSSLNIAFYVPCLFLFLLTVSSCAYAFPKFIAASPSSPPFAAFPDLLTQQGERNVDLGKLSGTTSHSLTHIGALLTLLPRRVAPAHIF